MNGIVIGEEYSDERRTTEHYEPLRDRRGGSPRSVRAASCDGPEGGGPYGS
jgi:hypothetical protein